MHFFFLSRLKVLERSGLFQEDVHSQHWGLEGGNMSAELRAKRRCFWQQSGSSQDLNRAAIPPSP